MSDMKKPYFFMKSFDFTKPFQQVVEWNAIARNGKHDFSEEAIDFQYTLIEEEFKELMDDGIKKKNKKEVLDALCDLFVVGSYHAYQINKGKMNSCEISCLLKTDYLDTLEYDVKHTKSSVLILEDVMVLLYQFGGDTEGALQEVIRSNYTKFPTKEELKAHYGKLNEEKLQEECKRIETSSEGRYTGVTYKKVKGHYVFLSDKGKILKPITFESPNLTPYFGE